MSMRVFIFVITNKLDKKKEMMARVYYTGDIHSGYGSKGLWPGPSEGGLLSK